MKEPVPVRAKVSVLKSVAYTADARIIKKKAETKKTIALFFKAYPPFKDFDTNCPSDMRHYNIE